MIDNGTEPAETMTAKEAAEILKLSAGYIVNTLIPDGELPGFKDKQRRCFLIPVAAVYEYAERKRKPASKVAHNVNPKFSNGAFPEHVSAGAKAANRLRLQLRIRARNPEEAVYYDSSGKEVKRQEWLEAGEKKRHLGGVLSGLD